MSKIIKRLITVAVVVALIAIGYSLVSNKKQGDQTLSTVGANTDSTNEVGDEFLATLLNLQVLKLDGDIFNANTFTGLQDFSITLVQLGNQGRPNPFAPIGSDLSPTSVVSSPSVITNTPTSISTSSTVLQGALLAGTVATERWFEWGLTESLGASTTKLLGSTSPYTATISGLTANTTYFYKAAAKINGQTVYGSVVSWKTLGTSN